MTTSVDGSEGAHVRNVLRGLRLRCDEPGCDAVLLLPAEDIPQWFVDGEPAPGWTVTKVDGIMRRTDYCPAHSAAGAKETP